MTASQLKRAVLRDRVADEQTAALQPFDGGPLPDPADGWLTSIPDDVELHLVGVRCIRMTDGSSVRYYRVLMRGSVLKKKRAKLRRKLRELDQSLAKVAKQETRTLLFLMGKH